MKRAWAALGWMGVACVGCNESARGSSAADASTMRGDVTGCEVGAPLAGAAYDITKSRFAFGSTPTEQDAGALVRWVGIDGVVAIQQSGGETGFLNASASEANLPDWSQDSTALASHVTSYFATFGVSACQIESSQDNSGSDGRIIALARAVDGIKVIESLAFARFDNQDQSTREGFYWPAIPADVVTSARAFQAMLADPTELAAYKAKLPAAAQGDGLVTIHHTNLASTSSFTAATTYDVASNADSLGLGTTLSFDAEGNPVSTNW